MPRITLNALCALSLLASPALADIVPNQPPQAYSGGAFGNAVSWISDINSDGYDDYIVGEPNGDVLNVQNAGFVHVYSGRTGALIRTHLSPNVSSNGQFGTAVLGIPDINADGTPDYLVGAPYEATTKGRVYTYSGKTGALIGTLTGASDLTYLGGSLARIPDCTGDGKDDYAIGRGGPFPVDGPVRIYSGATGNLWTTLNLPAGQSDTSFGKAIAGVPDVNGDGRGDIVVGAWTAETSQFTPNEGVLYVFSGMNGALLYSVDSPDDQTDGNFGFSVAGVPDVNGDGRGDILVGAPNEAVDGQGIVCGQVHVYSGINGAFIRTLNSPTPKAGGRFGWAVLGSPDLNGDGRGEIVVGARDETVTGLQTGKVYIFSGANGALMETRTAPVTGQAFGHALAMVPDANGDDRPDLLVGAPEHEVGATSNAGASFLWRLVENDQCSQWFPSKVITDGAWAFTTVGADTSGPASPLCNSGGSSQIDKDVYYEYVATCQGTLVVSLCSLADYDTRVAIYAGCGYVGSPTFACNLGTVLACNDNGQGCAGFTSKVQVPANPGDCFRIRIGGTNGASGSGAFTVTCVQTCFGDLNADGTVDGADLGMLLANWGDAGLADLDGNGVVDGADLGMLLAAWGACGAG